jgi:hypothetical protein
MALRQPRMGGGTLLVQPSDRMRTLADTCARARACVRVRVGGAAVRGAGAWCHTARVSQQRLLTSARAHL